MKKFLFKLNLSTFDGVDFTTGDLSDAQKEFVQKTVMMELGGLADDVLFKYAEKINYDPTSDEYSWRMYKDLPETTDHLIEGVTPDGLKYSLVDFVTRVYQEGNYIPLTDKQLKYGIDKQLAISGKLLGKNAKNRMRALLNQKVFNGYNVRYAQGQVSRANVKSNTKGFSLDDVAEIKADFIRRGVEPVEGDFYIFLISPEIEADIKKATDVNKSFTDIMKYKDTVQIIKGEIGAFGGFRFIVTNNIPVVDTNVHLCLAFGKEAFGAVAIDGEDAAGGFHVIYKPLGSGNDPLNQRASLGWKHDGFGTRILRDECMVRYECYHGSAIASAISDSDRTDYRGSHGAITPTLTAGSNMTIDVVGNWAPGNLLKLTAKAGSGYHLASSSIWTVASFAGVDIVEGNADSASIYVRVKNKATAVTIVAANAVQDE